MDTSNDFRLPRNTVPKKYTLQIRPDFGSFTFAGRELIDLDVNESTSSITLNAAELDITNARISQGTDQFQCRIELDPISERATLSIDGTLGIGEAVIEMDFRGVLNDQLSGFYRSQFISEEGETLHVATTQFEATDARKAFPCFDEPDFKAVFSVELDAPKGYLALSNAPQVSETPLDDGFVRYAFADTIPMSSYLVAFIVGPLEASEVEMSGSTAVRIISKPGQRHLHGFAIQVAIHALSFFTDWFSIPYPGDKLDLIAIPDFAFGAMENLGAVTFRETLLLVDPQRASRPELERIVDVICHEIAHMWFGDLVTMKWWNGLWLNEAFATFMELLATDAYNPDWNRWVSFGLSKGAALSIDGLHTTRSIEFKVEKPKDAEGMFDVLTYEKGASVLRMLERYLGEDTFRKGITSYLNAHRFANAETTDLWDALEEASGQPISETMADWVFQGGYPKVNIALEDSELVISQQPFAYLNSKIDTGSESEASMIGESWKIPLTIKIGNDTHKVLLGHRPITLRLTNASDVVIGNAGGWGFFRVSYDKALLTRLLENLDLLDDLEKFNLASDVWAQTISLQSTTESFFELLQACREVTEPSLWELLLSALTLMHFMGTSDQRESIAQKCREILAPLLERVGFEPRTGEKEGSSRLRASLISVLGTIGEDSETIAECKTLFVKEMSIEADIDPDIISAVLKVVAANGDEADFAFMLDRYRHPSTPQEENRYLMALTQFKQIELIRKIMNMTLDEIRSQNGPFVIAGLLNGRHSGAPAWKFLKENWETLLEKFPDNTVPRMLSGISALVSEESYGLENEVRDFLKNHKIASGEKSIQQTLERYSVNLAFRRALVTRPLQ